jgi:hypothetical protein
MQTSRIATYSDHCQQPPISTKQCNINARGGKALLESAAITNICPSRRDHHQQHTSLPAPVTSKASDGAKAASSAKKHSDKTNAPAVSTAATTASFLERLSPEMRQKILQATLIEPEPVSLHVRHTNKKAVLFRYVDASRMYRAPIGWSLATNGVRPPRVEIREWTLHGLPTAAVRRTCKWLYTEGVAVLYGENTFALGSISAGVHFMDMIGTATKYIRNLIVHPGGYTIATSSAFSTKLARANHFRQFVVSPYDLSLREGVPKDLVEKSSLMLKLL